MADSKNNRYSAAQVLALDHAGMQALGLSEFELMSRAGRSAWGYLLDLWPDARHLTVLCGTGNNGGDGYILAALAIQYGFDVECLATGAPKSEASQQALEGFRRAGGACTSWDGTSLDSDVLVDALLGTGLRSAPTGVVADMIAAVNQAKQAGTRVLALDLPSGLESDTGHVSGAAVRADATITFVGRKLGLSTGQGLEQAGELRFDDLGLPEVLHQRAEILARATTAREVGRWLPRVSPMAHKGTQGRLAVIGGCSGMLGSVILAGKSAARSGAGLVQVVTTSQQAGMVSLAVPELLTLGVRNPVADTRRLSAAVAAADAVVLGCGLGLGGWGAALFRQTLAFAVKLQKPVVVDADALTHLAASGQTYSRWVLTPHPKEAARLLGTDVAGIQADRPAAGRTIAERYGGVCVLKGPGSLVCRAETPAASGEESRVGCWINETGNSGLATGGTGDVLAGVIGSLLAQGMVGEQAAGVGVWLHGTAADELARQVSRRGMMAMDLVDQLGYILRRFEHDSGR